MHTLRFLLLLLAAGLIAPIGRAAEPPAAVQTAIKDILSVGKEGAGNDTAAVGWKALSTAGAAAILPTLAAFDQANPTAANWLRSAVDALVEAEQKTKRKLPVAELEEFLKDAKRNPAARRIAFELIRGDAPALAAALLPTLTNDPSREIRRDAIADRMDATKKLDATAQTTEFRKLFAMSRDKDQAEELAKLLDAAGVKVNLTEHFGYVTEWHVVGPFDSTAGVGLTKVYEPETKVDLTDKFPSAKGDAKIGWTYAQSDATFGSIDLNKDIGKHMDAAAYAFAVVMAENDMPVEIRMTTKNAVQVFLNGKKLYEKDEYHHGLYHDQHVATGPLKSGANQLLVKVCQNNQKDSWAQDWQFAARICDVTGGALPLKQSITMNGVSTVVPLGKLKPAAPKEDK